VARQSFQNRVSIAGTDAGSSCSTVAAVVPR
jgi:hypothetical protein